MKKALLAVILLLPIALAQPVLQEEIFDLQRDGSALHVVALHFDAPVQGNISYLLSDVYSDIDVTDGTHHVDSTIKKMENGYLVEAVLPEPTQVVRIHAFTDGVIFSSGSEKHFFTEFFFTETARNFSLKVYLPEGYGIAGDAYRPSDAVIGSDGRRVVLEWERQNQTQAVLFSVKYSPVFSTTEGLMGALVFVVAAGALFMFINSRKKINEAFLQGFRNDERKTITYLSEKKVALQSDLQKQFGFSRAKATRIVAELEKRGLVQKQKYGRTNRLQWSR